MLEFRKELKVLSSLSSSKRHSLISSTQSEQYSILLQARRERVRGFYETGRVFKGSKAAFDKENAEAEAANPVVEDLDD